MTDAIIPAITYRDPRAATRWLAEAFGFQLTMAIEGPPEQPAASHYEMAGPAGGRIMIGGEWSTRTVSPAGVRGVNTQSVHVRVPGGLDEHCAIAREKGAEIVAEPADQFFGDRTYRALDPEGHCWTFAAHIRDVSRAEAEQLIGMPIAARDWE
ncbi:VOC family protein [Gordonia shandongensis]|uniref:VOC family protein n=1 Tax=Gordonia shandongensis TaxID=376351 RepID=UPI00040049A8|nr:VOC family protein [Gordonia shandongensis]